MLIRKNSYARSRGFTLIEAMIAMVIMATGLLAIAKFQASLVASSASSKARAEAIAFAQQKIDEIRNYRTEDILISNLSNNTITSGTMPTDPTDGTYTDWPSTGAYPGINADFTRAWTVTTDGVTKEVMVTVSWTDPKENSGAFGEFVNLSTIIAWSDPQLAADVIDSLDFKPLVPSATGDAKLGNEAPVDLTNTDDYNTTDGTREDHDDGTIEVLDGGEVKLVDADGVVLLTLEDACNTGATTLTQCTDFVKVSGRVYIKDGFNSNNLSSVYVLASDAAFCALYNTANTYNHDVVTDYYYFDYRCYLGGSWHGNVGIVKPSNTSNYDVCVGDPDHNLVYKPEFATRRVYRGMIKEVYDQSDDSDNIDQDDEGNNTTGNVIAENDVGLPAFVSAGIADALELPNVAYETINDDYEYSNYLPGHNFLIVSGVSDADDCKTALEAVPDIEIANTTDSTTKMVGPFEGSPSDWFCLNAVQTHSSDTYVDGDGVTQTFDDSVPYYDVSDYRLVDDISYTDSSGTSQTGPGYSIESNCRYNPVNPPSELDYVYGSIYYTDATTSTSSGYVINTSDDVTLGTAANCTVTASSANADNRIFDYACQIYHTYDTATSTGTGWDGNVLIAPANNFGCSPAIYSYPTGSELTTDTGTQTGTAGTLDFSCSYIGPTGADLVVAHTLSSADSTPLDSDTVTFQTTVTNNGLANGTGISMTNAIPSGLTYVAASASISITAGTAGTDTVAGSWDDTTGAWTGISLLDSDQATLTWQATIDGGQVGTQITSVVTGFTADQTDTNTTADDTSETITVTSAATADLLYDVQLTSGNTSPAPGDTVTFVVTVTNQGGATEGGTPPGIQFPITLPANTSIGSANNELSSPYSVVASQGDYGATLAGNWTIGTLADGASATLTISGIAGTGGDFPTVTATRVAEVNLDPDPSDTYDVLSDTVTVASGNVADLVTVMSVSNNAPAIADTVTVTIVVTNNGPDAAKDITLKTNFNTTLPLSGLSYVASSANDITWDTATGIWTDNTFDLNNGDSKTLTFDVTIDSNAETYSPITVSTDNLTYAVATGTPASSDNVPTGDGTISQDLTVSSAASSVTLAGAINYSSTTNEVTDIKIYAVNAASAYPGSNETTCSFNAGDPSTSTAGDYTCTVTIDPSDTNGVYIVVTHANTVCSHNARNSSGTLTTAGSDEVYWLDSATLGSIDTGTVAIDAYDESGAKPNCP